MATQVAQAGSVAEAAPGSGDKRYLIGPVADFMCFGGASLLILPLLLLVPAATYTATLSAAMMLAANFINHPHFAHSYQIFYRGFQAKAFGDASPALRARYLFAGVIAPLLLVAFLAGSIIGQDYLLLGYAGNLTALLVGWHYVKQGYGLLMVDSALKRQFFTGPEKQLLLINAYAVWIAAWLRGNTAGVPRDLIGFPYESFALPAPLATAALVAALGTGAATAWMLVKRRRAAGGLPVNGVIAYGVSLYPWLLLSGFNPLWILVVPALHSLQYLAVVWRFQTNYEKDHAARPDYKAGSLARRICGTNPFAHLALFVVAGTVLGFFGFWLFPLLLGSMFAFDTAFSAGIVSSATVFMFAFWAFINVHHYLIDNVIWRRENPETKRYLFG